MKSKDYIRNLAEKEIPYDPYRETLFPGQRISAIEGFIKGYQVGQSTLEDLRRAFIAGKNLDSFEDFLKTII